MFQSKEITMRLLIVEDEVDVALTIEDVALGLGFEVVGIATNMQEALEIAPETEIALVDLRLADGITGPAIARALVAGWNIGVVFVTGSPELNEEVDGLLTIEKPATPDVVKAALQAAAKWRRSHAHA
jgi:DNA-binding response OmpR family regulator